MMKMKPLAVLTPPYIYQKPSTETTEYIIHRVEINILGFINAICCGYPVEKP